WTLSEPDPNIKFSPQYLIESRANQLYQCCLDELPWQQESITLFGRRHLQPRLQVWMGDQGVSYRYSGAVFQPAPWHPAVHALAEQLSLDLRQPFNSVLCNFYQHGQHRMGWHSDDEPELGENPIIASVSLGDPRRFLLRRKKNHRDKIEYALGHGTLLVMTGSTQRDWQHSVPKSARAVGQRINLTYRYVNARTF
ncbi:MAG: alpha-ketoglutarate-dependent dioxygenase AlkB, partial [Natronospirillum sp.]